MSLKPHQKEKFDETLDTLKTSKRVVIAGGAGVGKTYMVNELVKSLSGSTICSAPTQKAVTVLQQKVTAPVDFRTIHSALQYRMVLDNTTGEKNFIPFPNESYPPLKGIKYLIIDECSMIGIDMLMNIEMFASKQNTTVIFIGDNNQINPVKEPHSPVFLGYPYPSTELTDFKHPLKEDIWFTFSSYPMVTLTEIVRQSEDNPIIHLSRNMKEIFSYVPRHSGHEKGYFYTQNKDKIIENLVDSNGSDNFKYLAWSNNEVDSMNSRVRMAIYGHPNKIEKGETLVFNAPYRDYYLGQELLVEDLTIIEKEFSVVFESRPKVELKKVILKFYVINPVKDFYDGVTGIFVIHEDSEKDFKKIAYTLSNNGRNSKLDFKYKEAFLSLFADFKYNHALTVHKS